MSLINDALKKAQKQRTGAAPTLASLPGVGGESAARIARHSRPGGTNPMLIWIGAGAGVLLLGGGWFALRSAPEDRAQKAENRPAQTAPARSSDVRPPPPESTAPVTFVLPVAQVPKAEAPATSPKAEAREPGTGAPPPPLAVVPKPESAPASEPAAPARPALAPKLEPRAITFIESIRVAGIRASATDSKVLMNDRVYRIGDTVEHEMGLRLVAITANSLTFEDERGARFTRTF